MTHTRSLQKIKTETNKTIRQWFLRRDPRSLSNSTSKYRKTTENKHWEKIIHKNSRQRGHYSLQKPVLSRQTARRNSNPNYGEKRLRTESNLVSYAIQQIYNKCHLQRERESQYQSLRLSHLRAKNRNYRNHETNFPFNRSKCSKSQSANSINTQKKQEVPENWTTSKNDYTQNETSFKQRTKQKQCKTTQNNTLRSSVHTKLRKNVWSNQIYGS